MEKSQEKDLDSQIIKIIESSDRSSIINMMKFFFPKTIFFLNSKNNLYNNNLDITKNFNIKNFNQNFKKNELKIQIKHEHSKIDFFAESNTTEGLPIYDVFIKDDLVIACGGQFLKIYNKQNLKQPKFIFQDPEDEFYTLSYTEFYKQSSNQTGKIYLLAVGGKSKVINIIDLQLLKSKNQLIGHRKGILDLKFCPNEEKSFLLLSASQDFSIRLWNSLNGIQICIFGGPFGGHIADAISIDWHFSGEYFVSSGYDGYVKIWKINDEIEKNINLQSDENNKILISLKPVFSCNSIHDKNYVDCVKYNGNLILSKSIDGIILEWLPVFNQEAESFFIINTYKYFNKEAVWYIKFDVDIIKKNLVAVGNDEGRFYIFPMNNKVDKHNLKDEHFYKVSIWDEYHPQASLVRCVYLDRNSNYYVLGHENGNITLGQLNEFTSNY